MKRNVSIASIVSAAAISGGVLLISIAPSQAFGCPFKNKGINTSESVSPTLLSNKLDWTKMAIAGAGIATLGGLFAAGKAYKARLAAKTDTVLAEVPTKHPEVPADITSEELLYAPNSASKAEKDLLASGSHFTHL